MTATDLILTLGTKDAPLIVDVCLADDFAADPFLIPGSIRHTYTDMDGLRKKLQARTAVIVCQKGLKLSQGVAAWLRAEGERAQFLAGGMYGWRDHPGAPRIPAQAMPDVVDGQTTWVAPDKAKPDGLACLWLIRRFIDPDARILFVEPTEAATVADRFGATDLEAFATPLAPDGTHSRFKAMMTRLHLTLPSLNRMAEGLHAAGVHAICEGVHHLQLSDQGRLDAAVSIFDALFTQATYAQKRGAT
ncbi:MAG: chromate resistance protein ChrB domain-containing protein [Pseudomonadota bacterium]